LGPTWQYGGVDIPRYLTVLLYLSWKPRRGGALRAHLHDGPRDIAPVPGRCVVFFAQEVEHEVLPSEGQRFALTLWIWDVKRDELGR
jgi:Rps23 Pro-64 3,4-dihydroxylase Tpa1-like proline 4-hydroxylase